MLCQSLDTCCNLQLHPSGRCSGMQMVGRKPANVRGASGADHVSLSLFPRQGVPEETLRPGAGRRKLPPRARRCGNRCQRDRAFDWTFNGVKHKIGA